jgi:hypothetical protein
MYKFWATVLVSCFFFNHATVATAALSQARAASITLRAKWSGTPTLLEAAEYMVMAIVTAGKLEHARV